MEQILRQTAAEPDEAYVAYDGTAWWLSTPTWDIQAGYHIPINQKIGAAMRFLNITIPKGSHIVKASLRYIAFSDTVEDFVNTHIQAELAANPDAFSTIEDYLARNRTTPPLLFDAIPHWIHLEPYYSPDFASHIQQVIDLPEWESGNPVVIFWNDHTDRSTHAVATIRNAYPFHVSPLLAPQISITYTPPDEPPPPPPPPLMWALFNIYIGRTPTGYAIHVLTDVPVHLVMRSTLITPKEHIIPVLQRGLAIHTDKYFCFDVYEDFEPPPGPDTLEHCFIIEPWPECETRYFYFWGTIGGAISPSTSPIFKKHRPPLEFKTLIYEKWTS